MNLSIMEHAADGSSMENLALDATRDLLLTRPAALVLLAALNVFDVISTKASFAAGGQEQNPLSHWLLEAGFDRLLVAKLAMVALVAALALVRGANPARGIRFLWSAVLLYGLVVSWNCSLVLARQLLG